MSKSSILTFKKLLRIMQFVALFFHLESCGQGYDPELKRPDGVGKGYVLTPLGCLVNGPWQTYSSSGRYNRKLFIDNKEISSKGEPYNEIQNDLIFELHKDRTITYWLKSENKTIDTADANGIRIVRQQKSGYGDVKKLYTKGFWKVNFNDQTILIHFDERNIPELKFTYKDLGNGFVNFQQISYFDSLYNGNKVSVKQVNSMYYERLYPRF